MSKPRFADSWYQTPPVQQLRNEIQNIYSKLGTQDTWTPILGAATEDGTHTYDTQEGFYIRISNLVVAWFDILLSSKDTAMSGAVRIRGLPVDVDTSLEKIWGGVLIRAVNLTYTANSQLGLIVNEDTVIVIRETSSGASGAPLVNASDVADDTRISGVVAYIAGE